MKLRSQLIYMFMLIFFTASMVTSAMGNGRSEEEIALWVADRVGMSQPFDMPTRYYVDKATLGSVFKESNKQTYSSWQQEYGEDEAKRILEGYLDDILGLFNETTLIIYVANFIETCRQESIFAHEIAHYFQHLMDGVISDDNYYKDDERLLRELRAYDIEEKYRVAFCETDGVEAPDPENNATES